MLLFAVLSLLILKAESAWEDGDDGIDRAGGNLDHMPLPLDAFDPPALCAQICQSNPVCVAWAYSKPNCDGQSHPNCYLKGTVTTQSLNNCMVSGVKNAHLLTPKFVGIPVGSITPQGWLKEQLLRQRNGLSGHLPLFWADVENSSWIGGSADTNLHERFPYWLNGIVPLAYQLDDPQLKAMVEKYISYIIDHQSDEGWLGPDDRTDGNLYWSKYLMMFIFKQYYEATGNTTILSSMFKFLHEVHQRMFSIPLGDSWSGARWQDFVVTIHWLLDYHPSDQEQFLWDLAELVQQQGFRWKDYYGGPKFPNASVSEGLNLYDHGVNNGMAIKAGGVWYRQSHNQSDFESAYQTVKVLDKYHGQASGIFSCDEHLGGLMPSRGTELCTVVEAMFSFEVLFGIYGDPMFAERAEQITYNALPATFTHDMWAHQYLQQSNEINAKHSDDRVFVSDGPDANIYGLAPNYGCCTANFNQGWPKMTQSIAMVTPDGNSIVIGIYAPVQIKYEGVVLNIETDYPFNDTVLVTASCPTKKTIIFRVPSWANNPTIQVGGGEATPITKGELKEVDCQGSFSAQLTFPMKINVKRRYNNAISVYNGPLLYGLQITELFTILKNYSFESKDYQILNGSAWNYAIHLTDDDNVDQAFKFMNTGLKSGISPFSVLGAPSKIVAIGRLLDEWDIAHNAAAPPPQSPYTFKDFGPEVAVTLIPFGASDLRIAELPTYK